MRQKRSIKELQNLIETGKKNLEKAKQNKQLAFELYMQRQDIASLRNFRHQEAIERAERALLHHALEELANTPLYE